MRPLSLASPSPRRAHHLHTVSISPSRVGGLATSSRCVARAFFSPEIYLSIGPSLTFVVARAGALAAAAPGRPTTRLAALLEQVGGSTPRSERSEGISER